MRNQVVFAVFALLAAGLARGGTITVSQPAGGSFALGAACPVHWTTAGVNRRVNVQLIRPGGALVGLLASRLQPASSPFQWTVAAPAEAGGRYRIRISAADNSASGESPVFSVTAAAAPAPPAEAPRCDLGIRDIRYRDGDIIVSIENNGPDPLPLRDVKIRVLRNRGGAANEVITRQLAIPPRQHVNLTLAHVPPAAIPSSGLHFTYEVDAVRSGVRDDNPLNQRLGRTLCTLDIRCRLLQEDLVITQSDSPEGRRYRLRCKIRVGHNLDRPVVNINAFVYSYARGHIGDDHAGSGSFTIPAIPPGEEIVLQIDRTYGEWGRPNARPPLLHPGAEHVFVVDLCELGTEYCDMDYANNKARLIFTLPE